MARQDGTYMILKVGDGGDPEEFTTLGGLTLTRLALDNGAVEIPRVDGGAWRQALSGAGRRRLRLSAQGEFENSAAEETLRGYAFGNVAHNYELHFANGDAASGAFQVAAYEREGGYGEPERYSVTLESAGEVDFTPGM